MIKGRPPFPASADLHLWCSNTRGIRAPTAFKFSNCRPMTPRPWYNDNRHRFSVAIMLFLSQVYAIARYRLGLKHVCSSHCQFVRILPIDSAEVRWCENMIFLDFCQIKKIKEHSSLRSISSPSRLDLTFISARSHSISSISARSHTITSISARSHLHASRLDLTSNLHASLLDLSPISARSQLHASRLALTSISDRSHLNLG